MKNLRIYSLITGMLFCTATYAQTKDSLHQSITIGYEHYHFDKQFDKDWQIGSVEYKRAAQKSTYLGRFNYASRLGQTGWQAEAETYPKLTSKIYAYLGAGFSPSLPVFPKWRSGGTLFFVLPKGWEAEGGLRHLYFNQHVWMGTAGISKYAGNWLLNVRSFIGSRAPGSNHAVFFTARHYLKNERDFVWLQLGSGISPDESRNVLIEKGGVLSSKRVTTGVQLSLSKRYAMAAQVGWSRDEIGGGRKGNQFLGGLRVGYRF
jgi:YaiO family outer membrane protein